MSFTWRQIIFCLLFSVLLLLFFLLGDSFYRIALIGIATVGFLLLSTWLEWDRVREYGIELILWLVWITLLSVVSGWTHHVPLSLEYGVTVGFSFLFFWTFLLLPTTFISNRVFLYLITMTGLVLIVISWLFVFFPIWGILLPGMNLLYATYGHNHIAALILLLNPLLWWFFSYELQQKVRNRVALAIWAIYIFTATLLLVFSFGRIAIMIGAAQLCFIWWFWLRKLPQAYKFARYFVIFAQILVWFFLGSWVIMGVLFSWKSEYSCPLPNIRFCKSFAGEPRLLYWEQAIRAIVGYPLTGYGAGTFSLINARYKQTPDTSTWYAHNAFLQNWAETGLVAGSVFLVLILYLFKRAIQKPQIRETEISWRQALQLGVIGIYGDVIFDFDWNFMGIWLLTLLFLVLLIKRKTSRSQLVGWKKNVAHIGYLGIGMIILGITSVHFYTEYLIEEHKIDKAVEVFPYFHSHSKLFLSSELKPENRRRIAEIYHYDSQFLSELLLKHPNEVEQMSIKLKVWELDPWKRMYQMDTPEDASTVAQMIQHARRFYNFNNYPIIHAAAGRIATISMKLEAEQPSEQSLSLFYQAVELSPWLLHQTGLPYKKRTTDMKTECQFLEKLLPINADTFGDAREVYSNEYVRCLHFNRENMPQDLQIAFEQKITELTSWRTGEYLLYLEE